MAKATKLEMLKREWNTPEKMKEKELIAALKGHGFEVSKRRKSDPPDSSGWHTARIEKKKIYVLMESYGTGDWQLVCYDQRSLNYIQYLEIGCEVWDWTSGSDEKTLAHLLVLWGYWEAV